MAQKLLLHTCCGPCAVAIVNALRDRYDISLFYFNPNIFPRDEYEKRLENARIVAGKYDAELIKSEYCHDKWLDYVREYLGEKESGKRCELCFEFRLEKTAQFARENKFNAFATTLSISPHKNSRIINKIGGELGRKHGVKFLDDDFKARFSDSIKMSKELGLYRQKYCGCEFSRN